jgi:hypothetical protein
VTLGAFGTTATLATGIGVTVTVAVPDLPSLTAVIVDVPGATPVTRPLLETVATPGAPDVYVIGRPFSTFP